MCYNYELISMYNKDILASALANYVLDIYKLARVSRASSL